jgi:hypothetical protein
MNKIVEFSKVKSLEILSKGDVLRHNSGSKELITYVNLGENIILTKGVGSIPTAYLFIERNKYNLIGDTLKLISQNPQGYYVGADNLPSKFLKEFNNIRKEIKFVKGASN